METPNEIPTPTTERRPAASPFSLRSLLPGLAIGILLGIAGLLMYQSHLNGITKALQIVTLISFGVIVLTFLMVFVFRQFITRKILGENSVGDFLDDAQIVSDSVTDQLAKNLLVNVAPATSERVRKVLPRLASWFIWGRLRNWWWNWILGIFISLGGLTGTLTLMNQNELLEAQNKKIDDQTGLLKAQNELVSRQMQLEEANRRSALVVLMSNIMDKVDREIESQQTGLSMKAKEQKKYRLSQSLIGQIAALSHSFKPYRYMDGDSLIGRPLSPERGQLLITIIRLPLNSATFSQIYANSNFEAADLAGANLSSISLSQRGVISSNLSGVFLSKANLSGANLRTVDLSDTDLSEADLSDAHLTEANLFNVNLENANLKNADFTGDITELKRIIGDLMKLKEMPSGVTESALIEMYNIEANLTDANLSGANLKGAKINIGQAMQVRTLFNCLALHDSIQSVLVISHPQLFENPGY
jgi:hypothetical protein